MKKGNKKGVSKKKNGKKTLPKRYLCKNDGLHEDLKKLLKCHENILYFFVCNGIVTVTLKEDKTDAFVMKLCELTPFLNESKYLQVQSAFVVNKSCITDLKKQGNEWMVYLGPKIKIQMWATLKEEIEKLKMQNTARLYLKARFGISG
jgi:hypothetical protein